MTTPDPGAPPVRAAARDRAGPLLLLATVIGWGLNWPAMKLLLGVLPPFSIRWITGAMGFALLALIAWRLGERFAVPRAQWPRLILAGLLNVTGWMGLATFALLWLPAGEAVIACYTVPLWAALFAWALLGEAPGMRRASGMVLGIAGVSLLVVGPGIETGIEKLPGIAMAMGAASTFALGTVLTKRWPLALPPATSAAWQIAIGVAPLALLAVLLESPDLGALDAGGWALLAYGGAVSLGLAYLAWFAALKRLPAAAAATGTLLVPVVGVLGAVLVLGEPFGAVQVAALALTIGGVVLAIRG